MNNALEVSHLTKDYGSFKLDDVSFTVPGGTIMGLIGENGAGKSTTIKCVLNMVHRDGGKISVFGLDAVADEQAVKSQLGVVLDDCGYYNPFTPAQLDRIQKGIYPQWDSGLFRQYLSKFSLSEKKVIKDFSKGMRMKLALAAAFAVRPKLLILDEATSALDNESERWIQKSLEELSKNRTTITIAHRLSTIRDADEIIVITEEGIAERGTHAELLEKNGLYAAYYNM